MEEKLHRKTGKSEAHRPGPWLRKLHQTVEHEDTPQIRGMINKVSHLVECTSVDDQGGTLHEFA